MYECGFTLIDMTNEIAIKFMSTTCIALLQLNTTSFRTIPKDPDTILRGRASWQHLGDIYIIRRTEILNYLTYVVTSETICHRVVVGH